MVKFNGEVYSCADGPLNARGKTTWNWYDVYAGWQSLTGDGSWLDGQMNGPWVIEYVGSYVSRGFFVNGKRHGE